jgi:alpha-D-ribose 1-methylphosphonate 5-triphosphate synthase subunit PhnI
MGYVAVKGGREAIENAEQFLYYQRAKGTTDPIAVKQIADQLYLAVDRVMGEGALYAPNIAALALKQAAGDTFEAAFMVRAYRTTLPRVGYSVPVSTAEMRVIRRISAAFKDIPGGQILGPTSDYTLRLLDFDLLEESQSDTKRRFRDLAAQLEGIDPLPDTFPKVVEVLVREKLVVDRSSFWREEGEICDVTREVVPYPAPRSAVLQTLTRGETGGLLALAYSNMRGYGDVHPTIGELRVGYLPVEFKNPYTQRVETIGEVKVTEAEIIARFDSGSGGPKFTLGYGLCFGHNETKAIAMAVLDRAMQTENPESPSEDQEFVMSHIDGIESLGFCNHYKLPHYVTFQSDLDRLRRAQKLNGHR